MRNRLNCQRCITLNFIKLTFNNLFYKNCIKSGNMRNKLKCQGCITLNVMKLKFATRNTNSNNNMMLS